MSDDTIQEKLDGPMPYVGVYISAASVLCILVMAADAFNGWRLKKPWIPCKFSSLNAASLTVLAVTMKLSVDLNSNLVVSATDRHAKLVSMFFMSAAMANFMPSLGSMTDEELLLYERLSVMIADILAACLTNLPRAITTICHLNAIEKREKSVRKAFFLLGKTEQVVQLLQQREWPNLDHA